MPKPDGVEGAGLSYKEKESVAMIGRMKRFDKNGESILTPSLDDQDFPFPDFTRNDGIPSSRGQVAALNRKRQGGHV